jgi:hypothetical protein
VKILPEESIWTEFWKRYFRRPGGWRLFSGISAKGYPELLISGEKDSWLLRRESLYNGKSGIGGRISGDLKLDSEVDTYGFREIPKRYLEKIAAMDEGASSQDKTEIISKILKKPPTTLDKIRSPTIIHGPMMLSSQALPLISEEQEKLDHALNIEINKWKSRVRYIQ